MTQADRTYPQKMNLFTPPTFQSVISKKIIGQQQQYDLMNLRPTAGQQTFQVTALRIWVMGLKHLSTHVKKNSTLKL